jgi:hypothetical protein
MAASIARHWEATWLEFATRSLGETAHLSACIWLENDAGPDWALTDLRATVLETLRKIAQKIKDGRLNSDGTLLGVD